MKKMIPSIMLTPEYLEERHKDMFAESSRNPENMSYWLPKIAASTTSNYSVLTIPETKIIPMSYDLWNWLMSDNYKDEAIRVFDAFLKEEIKEFAEEHGDLFMKTGIFSNKFEFEVTQVQQHKLTEDKQVGQQFLDMFYTSVLYGAHMTNEIVFRKMFHPKEDIATIYGGMPLHTEFRVFYDFEFQEVIGVTNYWHPDVMLKGLNPEDLKVYSSVQDDLVQEYNLYKRYVASHVTSFLAGVTGLTGRWSVDVMKNGNDFHLIDMARMERSALRDKIEFI